MTKDLGDDRFIFWQAVFMLWIQQRRSLQADKRSLFYAKRYGESHP